MKVNVDYDTCSSSGLCAQICPDVFEVRSDNFLYVLMENPPESMRAAVTEAAASCPTNSITIED